MKKVVLLVMVALCFMAVSTSAWSAVTSAGDVVLQGPGAPQNPPPPWAITSLFEIAMTRVSITTGGSISRPPVFFPCRPAGSP